MIEIFRTDTGREFFSLNFEKISGKFRAIFVSEGMNFDFVSEILRDELVVFYITLENCTDTVTEKDGDLCAVLENHSNFRKFSLEFHFDSKKNCKIIRGLFTDNGNSIRFSLGPKNIYIPDILFSTERVFDLI